jgi:hypothetical protein
MYRYSRKPTIFNTRKRPKFLSGLAKRTDRRESIRCGMLIAKTDGGYGEVANLN